MVNGLDGTTYSLMNTEICQDNSIYELGIISYKNIILQSICKIMIVKINTQEKMWWSTS